MVTRRSISSGRFDLRATLILAVWFGVFIAFANPAFAQPAGRQEAMRQRVQWNVKIALDQYQRGLYKETQQTLLKTQNEYDAYMT